MSNLGNRRIISHNIQFYMDMHGKTRNDICRDLGIKYTTLADWLNGKTYPRIDKIELLARYFNVTKADLVEDHRTTTRTGSSDGAQLDDVYLRFARQAQEDGLSPEDLDLVKRCTPAPACAAAGQVFDALWISRWARGCTGIRSSFMPWQMTWSLTACVIPMEPTCRTQGSLST